MGLITTRGQDEARHRALRQRGRRLFLVKMAWSVVCGKLFSFPQGVLGLWLELHYSTTLQQLFIQIAAPYVHAYCAQVCVHMSTSVCPNTDIPPFIVSLKLLVLRNQLLTAHNELRCSLLCRDTGFLHHLPRSQLQIFEKNKKYCCEHMII